MCSTSPLFSLLSLLLSPPLSSLSSTLFSLPPSPLASLSTFSHFPASSAGVVGSPGSSQLYQSAYQATASGNVAKTGNPMHSAGTSVGVAGGGSVGRGGKGGEIPLTSSRPTTFCGSLYACLCCQKPQDGLLTSGGMVGNRGGVSYQALETGDSLIDNDNDKSFSNTSCFGIGNCITLFRFTVLVMTALLVAIFASYQDGLFSPILLGYDNPKDAPYLYITRYASRSILKFNRDGELLSSNVLGSDRDIAAIPTATSLRSMVVHPYKNIPKALYVAVAGLAADSPHDQSSIMVFGPEDKNHQRVYLDTLVSAEDTPGKDYYFMDGYHPSDLASPFSINYLTHRPLIYYHSFPP